MNTFDILGRVAVTEFDDEVGDYCKTKDALNEIKALEAELSDTHRKHKAFTKALTKQSQDRIKELEAEVARLKLAACNIAPIINDALRELIALEGNENIVALLGCAAEDLQAKAGEAE